MALLWNITLPLMFIFGTDEVLWPGTLLVDLHPPFIKSSSGKYIDNLGNPVEPCEEMPATFETLANAGVQIGILSHTKEVNGTEKLLHIFGYDKYVTYKELGPDLTMNKLERFHKRSGIEYYRTIFLDRKISIFKDLQLLGMTCLNCMDCASENIIRGCIRVFRQYREIPEDYEDE